METFLTVISFPFWFIGIFSFIAGIFGNVQVGRQTNTLEARFIVIMFSLVCLLVAWILV